MRLREVTSPSQGHRAGRWEGRIWTRWSGRRVCRGYFLPGLLGWWAVSPEMLPAVSTPPPKKACLRMKGTEEKVEPRRGERQTADMLSSRGPAVPKDHTSSLDDQRHG